MLRSRLLAVILAFPLPLSILGCSPPTGAVPTVARSPLARNIVLATTTSTQDSGLLEVLIPLFEEQTGYRVKVVSVGTGAALALGGNGEADVVLTHAPEAELQWMAEGKGIARLLVMHNDFVIVGPPADPAGIGAQTSAVAALQRIATAQAAWVSREDTSGTDQMEKQLWQLAGLEPRGSSWFMASGQGMSATLTLADQRQSYTISDRATYLARRGTIDAVILVQGDPQLLNIYHVMPVNPARFPRLPINAAGGKAFADFLVAPATQRAIGEFGVEQFGQPLFFPDAGKTEEQVRQ